jgi:hypothetical protein
MGGILPDRFAARALRARLGTFGHVTGISI